MNETALRFRSLGTALILAAGLGLAGCSSGSGSDEAAVSGATAADAPEEAGASSETLSRPETQADGARAYGSDTTTRSVAQVDGEPSSAAGPSIIQTGTMTVRSDDVARARFDLQKVVDAYDGSIADEKTTASTEGRMQLSRVELRIPSDDFDAAMTELAELGKVTASTRKAQDVTGDVIDTRARIRAQEESLQRVEVLFAQAEDIRDIVSIEAQLSRRQAELDSLKGQLAYLEDQTTLSTITVYLEQTPEEPAPPKAKDDDIAFVGGLKGGWHAMSELGAGLATVSGALLPFALVLLLLGVPVSVVARRRLTGHPLRRPATGA